MQNCFAFLISYHLLGKCLQGSFISSCHITRTTRLFGYTRLWKELPKFKDDLQTHIFNLLWESVRITTHRSNNSTQPHFRSCPQHPKHDRWLVEKDEEPHLLDKPTAFTCLHGACICASTHARACMDSKRPVSSSVHLYLMFWDWVDHWTWSLLHLLAVWPVTSVDSGPHAQMAGALPLSHLSPQLIFLFSFNWLTK